MYDYKFRQSQPNFAGPQRSRRKVVRRLAVLLVAVGILYGILRLLSPGSTDTSAETREQRDADVIPLAIPPYSDPAAVRLAKDQDKGPPATQSATQ